jgi:hypothetical protein
MAGKGYHFENVAYKLLASILGEANRLRSKKTIFGLLTKSPILVNFSSHLGDSPPPFFGQLSYRAYKANSHFQRSISGL